jgi:hypothetical protein
MPLDPFNALDAIDSAFSNINGATGGAASALLPPPFGTDNSIAPNAPGNNAIIQGANPLAGLLNIFNNFGVFVVGIMLLFIGALLLTFAWGEHLANAAESVLEKIPAVPV